MTDGRGTFEHAQYSEPRPSNGYCTDDMARVLLVSTREPNPSPTVRAFVRQSLTFLKRAQSLDGRYRNRLTGRGRWADRPTVDDCWGRSIRALGAAASSETAWVGQTAVSELGRALQQRSPWPRATAFAAIGAADLVAVHPGHRGARDLLAAAANEMARPRDEAGWRWPEARLTYANAVLPEAMIAAGVALDRMSLVERGLELLAWLLDHETTGGHLSVTPAGGDGPGDARPAFDQQPIEVASLAEACARAAAVDDDRRWADGVAAAAAWFLGANDGGHVMWDLATGGAFDGLEAGGVNRNQGTESTLALLATLQHARRLAPAAT